jgi:hypothetical protein
MDERTIVPILSKFRHFSMLLQFILKHNRPDIIILNKQQKQAYLLDIAVPNSHNMYNTDIRA